MDIISTIVPISLLVVSTICLAYFAFLLLNPIFKTLRLRGETNRIASLINKMNDIDELLAQKKPLLAIKLLKNAAYLDNIYTTNLLEVVREHHQNILSRCLLIAEELNTRVDHISSVEFLFQEYIELQKLFIKAYEAHSSLVNRRENTGKNTPQWTKDDFQKRISDIQNELNKCKSNLRKDLDTLFKSLEFTPNTNNITYH